jgi:tRNA/tmRNA/rRNA uracil-C5-methylase (TrmA/RlmC/RlmD family)
MPHALSPCPHRPPCPGCPRYGERGIAPAAAAALGALAREAGLAPPRAVQGAALGFRQRARLAVRGRARSPKLGIFQVGSHRIVDIPRCGIHHPLINRAASAVRGAIRSTGIAPYAERPHAGCLRYVQLVVERASQSVQLVLIAAGHDPAEVEPLLAPLRRELGTALHSVWWNGNPERTNAILGPAWAHLAGPEMVCESLAGTQVFFPPGAFGQSHLELAEQLAARVRGWVPAGARVAELYAGVGAIGLGLAERSAALRCNELDEHALRGLAAGVAALPPAVRARVELLPGRAGERLDALSDADVVIVDPPRRGLDPPLLDALCARPPAWLIYVSCGLPAFLRECAQLRGKAGLQLVELEAYALFPYTEHVETVALLRRR